MKDLKELLTAIQIGHADKMANVAKAIKLYNLTKEGMMEGDSRGRTPLHIASSYGYQNAVRIIVKENIDSINLCGKGENSICNCLQIFTPINSFPQ